jgi:hypothetical protein
MKKETLKFIKENNISNYSFDENENLTVGGSLYLGNTAITSLPDNLTVGDSLDLGNTAITSLPDNLTVGGSLDLGNTAITSLPDNLTVGDSLYLGNTAITSLPDNLTVGGSLYLRNTAITSLPDNLTVGGYLYLGNTAITSLPDNLTVGGSLDLGNTAITNKENYKRLSENHVFFWENSKNKFLKADGIFSQIVEKKRNIYTIKEFGSKKISYLATNGKYNAHGNTIEEAKRDLQFKRIAEKLKNEPINQDTVITVQYYRVVTGACESGVNSWMKKVFNQKDFDNAVKNGIKAKDLLPILKSHDAYGYDKFKSLINF